MSRLRVRFTDSRSGSYHETTLLEVDGYAFGIFAVYAEAWFAGYDAAYYKVVGQENEFFGYATRPEEISFWMEDGKDVLDPNYSVTKIKTERRLIKDGQA
jgi:hypothetical protein